jgi:hypothetical protein
MTWWVVAGVAAVGAVLSLIVAAVPAFWASRVSPVAAFKPVTDVTEAEVSRRVSPWWIAPVFPVGLVSLWVGTRDPDAVGFVGYLGAIVAGVSGFVLLKEGLRALLTARGRWLGRTRFAPFKAAGDGIVASPRSATANALLFALPLTLITWMVVVNNFSNLESHMASGRPSGTWPIPGHESAVVWATGGLLWALVLLAEFECVALTVTFANRSATAAAAATHRALGLSTLQQRQSAYLQHVVPQVGGAIVGTYVGFILGVATYFLAPSNGSARPGSAGDYLPAWWNSALSTGYLIALAGVFAALGGLIVAAAASRVRTPIDSLKPTGKVRVK